jgi:hypothetical protein
MILTAPSLDSRQKREFIAADDQLLMLFICVFISDELQVKFTFIAGHHQC